MNNKVTIFGKEYGFYLNVRAVKEISKLCTDGYFENFENDLNSKNDNDRFEFISKVIVALNKGYIMNYNIEHNLPFCWDDCDSLTIEILECLDINTFVNGVYIVALQSMFNDATVDIEVEPEKNQKKRPVKKSI